MYLEAGKAMRRRYISYYTFESFSAKMGYNNSLCCMNVSETKAF